MANTYLAEIASLILKNEIQELQMKLDAQILKAEKADKHLSNHPDDYNAQCAASLERDRVGTMHMDFQERTKRMYHEAEEYLNTH